MRWLPGSIGLLLLAASVHAGGEGPPARIALYIGIDEYVADKTIRSLSGCVNDIDRLAELMQNKYGFRPPRVRVLRNSQATRDAIRASLWWLVDEVKAAHDAGSRDIVVLFAYAGHGGLLESQSDDEKYDSTILPTDAKRRYEGHIRDDDLNRVLGLLQVEYGAAVVQVMDSCHSGTAYRSTEVGRVRSVVLPGDRPARSPEETIFDGTDGRPALPNRPNARIVYLGAVLDHGLAEEGRNPAGGQCGKFSWSLYRVLSTARPGLTYGELHGKLLRQFREDWRTSIMVSPAAISPSLQTTACFGGAVAPMHARMLAAPDEAGRVPLSLGSVHGVTEGAVFRFYRDLSDLQDRIGAVAQATVVQVEPTRCVAQFEKAPRLRDAVSLVARLDAASFPGFRVAARGQLPPYARAALERLAMPLVEADDAPDLLLESSADGVRVFLPRTLLAGTGEPTALFGPLGPRDIEDTLSRYARVQRLLGLERSEDDLEVGLRLHGGSKGEVRPTEDGIRRFRNGTLVDLSISNPRDKPVYVYAFALEEALDDPARSSFGLFFPGEDPSVVYRIEPGATLLLDDYPEEPGIPAETQYKNGSRITLKFLVTEKPYPMSAFAGLEQRTGGARGDADDLQWFLRQAAGGRAGARDAGDALRGWWATQSLVIDVLP